MATQIFKFQSKSSTATHTVTVGANGHIVCTCRGFDTPSRCWHVREVAAKLGLATPGVRTVQIDGFTVTLTNDEIQCECSAFSTPAKCEHVRKGMDHFNFEKQPKVIRTNGGSLQGPEHWNWKGGVTVKEGYTYIYAPGHPHAPESGSRSVRQAVLVLEKKLGRYLTEGEVAHHINNTRSDDRPENLEPMLEAAHRALTAREAAERGAYTNAHAHQERDIDGKFLSAIVPASFFVEPMLGRALKEDESIDDYENDPAWSLEEKIDGMRVIVHVDDQRRVTMWSRDGNEQQFSTYIWNRLQYAAAGVYDGELFVPGKSSTDVKRLDLRSKQKLVLFDVLSVHVPDDGSYRSTLHLPLTSRRELLFLGLSQVPADGEVFQAPVRSVSRRILDEIWAAGGEGVMLKRNDESYLPGARRWLKFKKLQSARVRVIGYKAGKFGPHAVVIGEDEHGVRVQCKALDTAMRAKFFANPDSFIGRTLVISYQQKTADGKYRHPRCDHFEE